VQKLLTLDQQSFCRTPGAGWFQVRIASSTPSLPLPRQTHDIVVVAQPNAASCVSPWLGFYLACETLHFIGLALVIGNIGLLDLRLLGVEKRIPVAPLSNSSDGPLLAS
jgi:hypothetical protein